MRDLFEAQRDNEYLRILYIDDNGTNQAGWAAAKSCLNHNQTLMELPYPKIDFGFAVGACKDKTAKDRLNKQLKGLTSEIRKKLSSNRSNEPKPRPERVSQRRNAPPLARKILNLSLRNRNANHSAT